MQKSERFEKKSVPEESEEPREIELRDRFAQAAIAGVALHQPDRLNILAAGAYALADAMMAAREKKAP